MFFFLFSLIKSILRVKRYEDVADLPVSVQQAIDEITVNSYREYFLFWLNTILRGNDIVFCANVFANNDGTDFSYWCAGLRDLTLP